MCIVNPSDMLQWMTQCKTCATVYNSLLLLVHVDSFCTPIGQSIQIHHPTNFGEAERIRLVTAELIRDNLL